MANIVKKKMTIKHKHVFFALLQTNQLNTTEAGWPKKTNESFSF